MTTKYDFSTALAVCNDAQAETWEVQATGSDGQQWTVSDSTQMSQEQAESLASKMRSGL